MARSTRCRSAVLHVLSLLLLIGCDSAVEPRRATIELVNLTDLTLYVIVVELERSERIAWTAWHEVDADDPKVMAPGASRTLTSSDIVGGYERGQGVHIRLHAVRDGGAFYTGFLDLTHEELKAVRFRVEIRSAE